MLSSLSKEEFELRLKNLTRSGEPVFMGTPLAMLAMNGSMKPFYGEVTSDKFRFTKNATFLPTPFIVVGNFKEYQNITEVEYSIKPIWFGYLWIRILPVLALIFVNILFIKESIANMYVVLPINLFLLLMFLPILITNQIKINMERRFVKSLEIQ
ncbi:hypothetical protein GCM10009122_27220 [Fulvivirga kasyanovii]|uniref:Uncharacterized protein n=1 Tax=Fulvivirga kasyanovii TaxID=396812 RepID=A0ABW9RRA6_9BACT|nr:hypothetical protein [Fulvivirga kasyanovii]MTI26708.1 hypothetical protein [Fulvivirga kasyanovii]